MMPKQGHSSIRESHFQKQICLLTGRHPLKQREQKNFSLQTVVPDLALARVPTFLGKLFPTLRPSTIELAGSITTGCARLVAEVTHVIVERKLGTQV